MYNEVTGNLITKTLNGEFDVIIHGCNCFSTMGAGIAVDMAKYFGCDKFPMELDKSNPIGKLGCIDAQRFVKGKTEEELFVINAYTQFNFGRSSVQLDYEAITLCLRKVNYRFKHKHIGIPYVIGCGLAGGDIDRVLEIIKTELCDMDITMVKYDFSKVLGDTGNTLVIQ
jgi:O-acetyl-ADP-ribose deacetylase (regulator of RNase III)